MNPPNDGTSISVFQAKPPEQRKTIVANKEQRIHHPNLIPDEIVQDDFLNSLINSSLPKNYNFEIHKTVWKIKQIDARKVILQFPEGLIRFGTVIVDIMDAYFQDKCHPGVEFIIMGDLTYGACCIDDYLASSMDCDLIVHYAHSCLVPINQLSTRVKYLYVFLDIRFDLEHLVDCVKHNFNPSDHHIALASTIQFVASAHEVARRLRLMDYKITLPQSRPLSSGEVLGCTAPKLDKSVTTILFICDGRFHLEALMIANPTIEAYRYDPYSRKMTIEKYLFNDMFSLRERAINKAVETMEQGGTFGIILGTLGRQGSEKVYDRLVEQLGSKTNCKFIKMMMPEIDQEILKSNSHVKVWVQVACPRLSIDWGGFFEAPLLNPYEFSQSIKIFGGGKLNREVYPMDFYAKASCGDHTPNHTCLNNPSCSCDA